MLKVKYIAIILNIFSKQLPKKKEGERADLAIAYYWKFQSIWVIYLNEWELVRKTVMKMLDPIWIWNTLNSFKKHSNYMQNNKG